MKAMADPIGQHQDVALHLEDVVFHYGDRRILDNLSLTLRSGEFCSVVGPSGCGKSTLLRLIAGLERQASGTVEVPARLGGKGHYTGGTIIVFQDLALLPWRTAAGNIEVALEMRGMPRSARRAVVAQSLALVGLSDKADLHPYQLSGGMAQRVALARGLALEPDVLLLDEPFAALDAYSRLQMQAEVSQIVSRTKAAVLLVTHSVDEAVFLADKVLIMSHQPAAKLQEVAIPFGRPRAPELRRSGEFKSMVDDILLELDPRTVSD
jgi:NitT/TauT family transport system ATP-binding protein